MVYIVYVILSKTEIITSFQFPVPKFSRFKQMVIHNHFGSSYICLLEGTPEVITSNYSYLGAGLTDIYLDPVNHVR